MKRIILLFLGIILAMPLFVSCSSDDEMPPPTPFASDPKPDIEFKGSDLNTVKKALQGSWWLKRSGTTEYKEGEGECMIIRGNKIAFKAGTLRGNEDEPKWYDITWSESKIGSEGEMMHAFYPLYDNLELIMFAIPFIPYKIENNILYMYSQDAEFYDCYSLLLKATSRTPQ